MNPAVGVDIGGTKVSAALVSADGTIGPVLRAPTPARSGPDAVLDTVATLVTRLPGLGPVRGVGIGTAGLVRDGRIVSSTDTFSHWVGTDVAAGIRSRLPDALGTRVRVCNDVNAHALGESWRGAGRDAATILMVAVGTGVGGAIVTRGRTWSGAHQVAGEIGHIPTPGAEKLRCPCGRLGHLEALAAGPAIAARYRDQGGHATSAREVVERAGDGEQLAINVVADAATGLGRALAGIITLLDPDRVVVGGGVAAAGSIWWDPLLDACRAELVDAFTTIPIVPAQLGETAALAGAARLVLDPIGTD